MARPHTCPLCNGTGQITEYETWERAQMVMAEQVESAERTGRTLISLDVEGSYPVAIVSGLVYTLEQPLEAVERVLGMWEERADGLPVSPYNSDVGEYRPVDPRFWEQPHG